MSNEIKFDKIKLNNGETLAYRKAGEGNKVLLLVHGNTSSSKDWDLFMENISAKKYTLYAPDLRGFGESSYNEKIDRIEDFAEDLKLFCDKLGLKEFNLIGWGAGGAISMRFTINYQEYVQKLILLESSSIKGFPIYKEGEYLASREEIKEVVKPALKAYKWKDKFILNKIARWTMKKVCERSKFTTHTPESDRYEAYIDEMLKQRNLVDINFALSYFNISHEHNGLIEGTGEVDEIEVPTLVVYGDHDEVVTREMEEETVNGIGENAELKIIKNTGHSPFIDRLEDLIAIVDNFLK